jgi:acyl carrier protein
MMRSVPIAWSGILTIMAVACISCNPGASPTIKSRSTSAGQDSNKLSQEVLARVTQIVAESLRLKPEEVNVDAPLSKQKNPADELDVVEIVMMVEEAYQVEVKDEEVGGTLDHVATNLTVRKLTDIVVKQKGNN